MNNFSQDLFKEEIIKPTEIDLSQCGALFPKAIVKSIQSIIELCRFRNDKWEKFSMEDYIKQIGYTIESEQNLAMLDLLIFEEYLECIEDK